MEWVVEAVLSFIASVCFSIIFNAPTHLIMYGGCAGMTGWTTYRIAHLLVDDVMIASFLGAFAVSLIAHVFSRTFKTPMIIFSVAGIIPLVPGGMAYRTMRSIVENEYVEAIQSGSAALLVSGAIAIGLIFAEVTMQALHVWRERLKS